jgi:hypothetical protein
MATDADDTAATVFARLARIADASLRAGVGSWVLSPNALIPKYGTWDYLHFERWFREHVLLSCASVTGEKLHAHLESLRKGETVTVQSLMKLEAVPWSKETSGIAFSEFRQWWESPDAWPWRAQNRVLLNKMEVDFARVDTQGKHALGVQEMKQFLGRLHYVPTPVQSMLQSMYDAKVAPSPTVQQSADKKDVSPAPPVLVLPTDKLATPYLVSPSHSSTGGGTQAEDPSAKYSLASIIQDVLAKSQASGLLGHVHVETDWHAQFTDAQAQPDSPAKFRRLAQLSDDFVYCASVYGRIIIQVG